MGSKNITLKVDEDLYNTYKEYCKKKGLVISRQFEIFAEEQLKKDEIRE
jgi:antitoxin component of RelBE/YafQ-DinJ toxin-antitoxin module